MLHASIHEVSHVACMHEALASSEAERRADSVHQGSRGDTRALRWV